MVAAIQHILKSKLIGANTSRTFFTQAMLLGMVAGAQRGASGQSEPDGSVSGSVAAAGATSASASRKTAYDPRRLVRDNDGMRAGELNKYVTRTSVTDGGHRPVNGKRRRTSAGPLITGAAGSSSSQSSNAIRRVVGLSTELCVQSWACAAKHVVGALAAPREWAECDLASIHGLLQAVTSFSSRSLAPLFSSHILVGRIDRQYVLLQHLTKLYAVHVGAVSEAFFYQQVLRHWGNLPVLRLTQPPSLEDLYLTASPAAAAGIGGAHGSGHETSDGRRCEDNGACGGAHSANMIRAARVASELLTSHAEMLLEYVSIEITHDGRFAALPQLIDGYVPPLNGLPSFVRRLADEVDWTNEQPCFDGLARQLAEFYRMDHVGRATNEVSSGSVEGGLEGGEGGAGGGTEGGAEGGAEGALRRSEGACGELWTMQHVLLPAIRRGYEPPSLHASNGAVVQLACTEMLYKVFERC